MQSHNPEISYGTMPEQKNVYSLRSETFTNKVQNAFNRKILGTISYSDAADLIPIIGGVKMVGESFMGRTIAGESLAGKAAAHGAIGITSIGLDLVTGLGGTAEKGGLKIAVAAEKAAQNNLLIRVAPKVAPSMEKIGQYYIKNAPKLNKAAKSFKAVKKYAVKKKNEANSESMNEKTSKNNSLTYVNPKINPTTSEYSKVPYNTQLQQQYHLKKTA